ncbi:EAL domain-containing protein [Achromobacter sp.]|uniref:EAL domain-containing protein n=1 Tax=Achromobacter sp. TaxID=134375 RepID=UPI002F922311
MLADRAAIRHFDRVLASACMEYCWVESLAQLGASLQGGAVGVVVAEVSGLNADGIRLPACVRQFCERDGEGEGAQPVIVLLQGDIAYGTLVRHAEISRDQGLDVRVVRREGRMSGVLEILRGILSAPPKGRTKRRHNGYGSLKESDLRRGLSSPGEVRIVLQPQYELASGLLAGAEALVRWRHERVGEVPAIVTVTLAHRHGLGDALFHHVAGLTASVLARLQRAGEGLRIAINVSADVLCAPQFVPRLIGDFGRLGLDAKRLTVELTEDMPADDLLCLSTALNLLRLHGFGASMDDFGVGNSTPELLTRLPFDELKIDSRYVRRAAIDPAARAVLASALQLSRDLGLRSVAEGIETPEGLALVTSMGCQIGQGFLLSPPLEVGEFQGELPRLRRLS